MNYRIQMFDKTFDTNQFCCGNHDLDKYIRRYASQDMKRNLTRVFVATAQNSNTLAGFFTLSAGSVNCSDLPLELAKKLPRYPIPIALLGRLAVDKSFQGKGLGSILVAEACQKVAQASTVFAVAGIMVDAKDQIAVSFYQHFGFKSLPENAERLFLPTCKTK
jgi:ribosomal protein S18 acetylase RimI-like enzyme